MKTAEEKDAIVTVGIKPTFPATAYGYIRYEDVPSPVKPVRQFVEKPDLARAEEYLKSGEFVWNSGMFIWKASLILQKLEKYLPELYQELLRIGEAVGTDREEDVISSVYPEMPSISVDYGVLEKTDGIYVVPADLGWSDVGSLDMLGAVRRADENDNVTVGRRTPSIPTTPSSIRAASPSARSAWTTSSSSIRPTSFWCAPRSARRTSRRSWKNSVQREKRNCFEALPRRI